MEFKIEAICVLTLEHKKGENTSRHISTDFNLSVSKNVDPSNFINKEGLPNKSGVNALTQCFVQGLIGNIHAAHQKGYRDSAEHLRYIISELEKGFAKVANVSKGNFPDLNS